MSEKQKFELKWPKCDYQHVRGHILKFPSGVIGVPITYQKEGWWTVMVVGGDDTFYPVGGGDILVPPKDIEAAERIIVN